MFCNTQNIIMSLLDNYYLPISFFTFLVLSDVIIGWDVTCLIENWKHLLPDILKTYIALNYFADWIFTVVIEMAQVLANDQFLEILELISNIAPTCINL